MKLKINETELTKPTSFTVNIIELSEDYIMSDGTNKRDIVTTKREISITFNTLSWAKCSELLTLLSEPFFDLTYPDPVTGIYETKKFFIKDKSSPFATEHKGELYWEGLSMVLKER